MKVASLLAAVLLISSASWAQQSKIVTPETTADLRQLCKSFQLVALESDLNKDMSWTEVYAGASCLNFVMGVIQTVGALDVGYFPELKFELADSRNKLPFRDVVSAITKYIDAHPEHLKEPPAPVILIALMEAKIMLPKHWEQNKK